MPAHRSLATFIVSLFVVFAAISFAGNALPGAYGSFVPSVIREEHVRNHAIMEIRNPCVALFGDSRVAFNISGAVLDRSLSDNCKSQNYAFPGIELDVVEQLTRDVEASVAVVCPTETMLVKPLEFWASFWELQFRLSKRVLRISWLRDRFLGYSRMAQFWQFISRHTPPLSDGWDWSPQQKRWSSASIEKRELVSLPTYATEASAMAADYFSNKTVGSGNELAELITKLKRRGAVVALLIPPSESLFQTQPASATQHESWQVMRQIARDLDTPLIDCSNADACGIRPSNFADPVHLNDRGVEAYSTFLADKIRAIVP